MIRVLIVDDMRLHCEGLARLLESAAGIEVVGTTGQWEEAAAQILASRPGMVLLSMGLPNGVTVLRAIVNAAPDVPIIALGMSEEEEHIIACAEIGVAGYLLREASVDNLVALIQSVARGETLCSPRVAATLLKRVTALAVHGHSPMRAEQLTPREREIVQLIDLGLSNKEISQRLCVEVRTVKTHVHNILQKLQVHRRGEAAARLRTAQPTGPTTHVHPAGSSLTQRMD